MAIEKEEVATHGIPLGEQGVQQTIDNANEQRITPQMQALLQKANQTRKDEAAQQQQQQEQVPSRLEALLVDPLKTTAGGWLSFWKRKVPSEERLQWTPQQLATPLLQREYSPEERKSALRYWRTLQNLLGEETTTDQGFRVGVVGLCGELMQKAQQPLRDELWVQIMKQLNGNPSQTSVQRGWELMAVLAQVMRPTTPQMVTFWLGYAEAQLEQAGGPLPLDPQETTTTTCKPKELSLRLRGLMARVLNRLRYQQNMREDRHSPPRLVEVCHLMDHAPYRQQVFGEALEEVMRYPALVDTAQQIPKALAFLALQIIELGGCATQGIFRVPGMQDEIYAIKVAIEQGDYEKAKQCKDPAVPASLLKAWFRELPTPIVPPTLYDRCLAIEDDFEAAIELLDEMPPCNQRILRFLAKFLQVVGHPQYHQATRMTVSNLAMVFAPNILRTPVDDPMVMLHSSRFQTNYLKLLINHLAD